MPPRVAKRREVIEFEFDVDDLVYVNGTMQDRIRERVHEDGHNLYRVANNGWVRGDEMRREPWKWYSFVRNWNNEDAVFGPYVSKAMAVADMPYMVKEEDYDIVREDQI